MTIRFFKSAGEFRRWLNRNHHRAAELWVGFHRKHSIKTGITYPEALDEALCFGWIDGIRKRVDAFRYTNRFSPRRARSAWSLINIKRARFLVRQGRMDPAGVEAFAARDRRPPRVPPTPGPDRPFDPRSKREFQANRKAWTFFLAQPPGYGRKARRWVMCAKQEETRRRRLARLIDHSAKATRIAPI